MTITITASCLISCTHGGADGTKRARIGRHGSMEPAGGGKGR